MKKIQQLTTATLLTLILATGAFAGIIQGGAPTAAPPDNTQGNAPATIPMSAVALQVLQIVLAGH